MSEQVIQETELEASFRRIGESHRAYTQAVDADVAAALALAEAKDEKKKTASLLNRLRHELIDSVEGETKDYPLFPRPSDNGSAPAAESDETAERFHLLLIPGIPSSVALALADISIHTLGDLAAFTNRGAKLGDVKGITAEAAEKTTEALAEFWKKRGAA